jgi:hypothetical protein
MPGSSCLVAPAASWRSVRQGLALLLLSLCLQGLLAFLFGHAYDMRIFMATGYLAGTGGDPYAARDLSAVFHDPGFRGITTIGYPPPWALVAGLLYRVVYFPFRSLRLYNLALKAPIIAANFCLAGLAARILEEQGSGAAQARKAWLFLLFNPFLLYTSSAWGQFDTLVALCSLLALWLLHRSRTLAAAILLALAISLKPTALPLAAVGLLPGSGRPWRWLGGLALGFLAFVLSPFLALGWSAAPILRGWNAHFAVAGGMSPLSFFELWRGTYHLPGAMWLVGLAWLPALAVGALTLRRRPAVYTDLLKAGLALTLLVFLTRAWLSEPNVNLVLPLVLLLVLLGELPPLALTAVWVVPLIFTVLNDSLPQLLAFSFPGLARGMFKLSGQARALRILARSAVVVPWQVAGWWIVRRCYRNGSC